MSKIKSVLSVAVDILKLNGATYLHDEKTVAEYGEELQSIITQDRLSFEEALCEALEGIKEPLPAITMTAKETVAHNRALDQAIALVRSIYRDSK